MTEQEVVNLLMLQGELGQSVHQLDRVLSSLRTLGLEKHLPDLQKGPEFLKSLVIVNNALKSLIEEEIKKLKAEMDTKASA